MTRPAPLPDLLRQTDVCARLGISDQTWMRWRAAKKTPEAVVLPSGRLKWKRTDIDRMLTTASVEPRRRYFGSVSRLHAATVAPLALAQKSTPVASTGGGR